MTGHEEWNFGRFIQFVRKATGTLVVNLDDLTENEMNMLLNTIQTINGYEMYLLNGDKLSASDMSEILSAHITLKSFKNLLGYNQFSDEAFMHWVYVETHTPVDPVDPIDPVDEDEKDDESDDEVEIEEITEIYIEDLT